MTDTFTIAKPITLGGGNDFVQNSRYYLPDPDRPGKQIIRTRATTYAKTISDTFKINQWGKRMVLRGVTARPSIIAQVQVILNEKLDRTDEDRAVQELAETATVVAAAKVGSDLGTALHSFTEQHDTGQAPTVPEPWDRDLIAYSRILAKVRASVVPDYIERIVLVKAQGVAGKYDRILELAEPCPTCKARYRVGDLKTGRDLQYGWNEIAVQLALYAHADLQLVVTDDTEPNYWEPMPTICQCLAYVIHLPVGQGLCTLYKMDIEAGWYGVELCELVRKWRKRKNLAEPIAQVEVTGAPGLWDITDHMLSWDEQIELATSVGELSEIWRAARKAKQWTPELEAKGKQRQAELAS